MNTCCDTISHIIDLYYSLEDLHEIYEILQNGKNSAEPLRIKLKTIAFNAATVLEEYENPCTTCQNNIMQYKGRFFNLFNY